MSSAKGKACLWTTAGTQINNIFQRSAIDGITSYSYFASVLHQKACNKKAPTRNPERKLSFFSLRSFSTWRTWRAWPLQCADDALKEKDFQEQPENITWVPPCSCHHKCMQHRPLLVGHEKRWRHRPRLCMATKIDTTSTHMTFIPIQNNRERKLSYRVMLKRSQKQGILTTPPHALAFTPPWMFPFQHPWSSRLCPGHLVLLQHKQLA